MPNTRYATDQTVGANLDRRTATPEFELGQTVVGNKNQAFVYVKAGGAIAAAATAAVDANFVATAGAGSYTADAAFAANEYGFIRKTAVAF